MNKNKNPLINGFCQNNLATQAPERQNILDYNEARQLDHMQTIFTLLQTDNYASTSSLKFFTDQMLFLTPSQQHQSTEGSDWVNA